MARMDFVVRLILGLSLTLFFANIGFSQSDQEALQLEESEDYFQKWLKEDVVYIISEEEKAVFQKLTSLEEKEQFIEQFWFRRDSDPQTAFNEYKEEHYRRIAYANEKFTSGFPGWQNDRGRVYIIHGPPAEIERYPTGSGNYNRPMEEGGGTTSVYPFETWRYRHIDQIGENIILEFVDKNMTGEYRLALNREEKDAMLNIDGVGPTLAESFGLAQKSERPWFSGNRTTSSYPLMIEGEQDSQFRRYEIHALVQRPLEIKYDDLKELVKINVQYDLLPFSVREDYFRLNEKDFLVPVSVQIQNKDLSFKIEDGLQVARVAIYGIVTSITNHIVTEFEDDLILQFKPETFQQDLLRSSMYQRIVPVDRKLRYKLDLVVKDLNSEHMGVLRRAIVPPAFTGEKLASSSLILSSSIQVLDEIPEDNERFVLGDVKILPSVQKVFSSERSLGVYFQIYNAAIDQASYVPSLEISYRLFQDGKMLLETTDKNGESTQYFSSQRVVLIKELTFNGLEDGTYQLEVEVHDRLTDQRLKINDSLTLVG